MSTVEVNPAVSVEEWQAFLQRVPGATYAHLPQSRAYLKESLGHEPHYVFARNGSGGLSGVLPLFRVRSLLTGDRLVSVPFASECGPVAESEDALKEMVDRARGLRDELRCRYLEIRTSRPLPLDLPLSQYFSTYRVPLHDPREMWHSLDHRTRNAVSKSRRRGVTVRRDDSEGGLKAFYEVNLRTKTRLGSPAHPLNLFKAMRQEMGRHFRLYLAEVEGRVVSGAIAVFYNGTVSAVYQASDSAYLNHHPNDAVTWQEMEDGAKQGFRHLDFGKTAAGNAGLSHYKKKWKAEEKTLLFYYHPRVPDLIGLDRQGTRFKVVTGVWKRLPLPLARLLGPLAFRQLD